MLIRCFGLACTLLVVLVAQSAPAQPAPRIFLDPPVIAVPAGGVGREFGFSLRVADIPAGGLRGFALGIRFACNNTTPIASAQLVRGNTANLASITVSAPVSETDPPTAVGTGTSAFLLSGLGPFIFDAISGVVSTDPAFVCPTNLGFTAGVSPLACGLSRDVDPKPSGNGALIEYLGYVGRNVPNGTSCQIQIVPLPGQETEPLLRGETDDLSNPIVTGATLNVGNVDPCATITCGTCQTCNAGACVPNPAAAGTQCTTDTDLCTSQQCDASGACVVAATVTCPNDQCIKDSCNPATGVCEAESAGTGCQTDSDLCTTQTCNGSGACQVASTVTCPNDQCIQDSCNPATGTCQPEPATTACETDTDLCTSQTCNGAGACEVSSTVTCADSPCVQDSCNPATGQCAPEPADTSCTTDSNLCTTQACDGSGSCTVKETVTCTASQCIQDACNPTSGVCEPESQGTPCDADGDSCTIDQCDGAGQCTETGSNPTCADENCTNGQDDDADARIDGADPDCNAKNTLKCQKSIESAGKKLLNLVLVRTKGCTSKLLDAQLAGERDSDTGADAAFSAAIDACDGEIGKLIDPAKGDRAKGAAKIRKDCAAVDLEILLQATQGLGFGSLQAECSQRGIPLATADDVVRCIDSVVVGLSSRSSSTTIPRSCGLLDRADDATAPVDSSGKRSGAFEDRTRAYLAEIAPALVCSADPPSLATASPQKTSVVLGCQMKVESAVRSFVRKVSTGVLACVDALLAPQLTLETGGDPKDKFQKALDTCDTQLAKVFVGDKSAQAKTADSIRDGCSALSGSEIVATTKGLGFETLEARCTTDLGIVLDDAEAVIECLDKATVAEGTRIATRLKPRACELVDRALATAPCASGTGKSCLDDSSRQILVQLRPELICTP